ncbi:MAG TPA: C39 family peptidase, partial [Chloroflexia bacterium]|nr:C39 family peptidase [Chloroflexia bacterium]
TTNGAIVRTRYVGTAPVAGKPVQDLPVPYISQVWDTGVAFNGSWACGPTSVDMVLAYYGRLTPWPFTAGQARLSAEDQLPLQAAGAEPGSLDLQDGRLYGQYVIAPFTYKGRTFAAAGVDPAGHRVQGLYGTIVGNLALARWEVMIDVLNLYNIDTDYIPVSWNEITAQIAKGNPVMLGTALTSSGHILVARGYTANGYLIVNDPYGNRFAGYGDDNGGNIAYPWKKLQAKLAMVLRGTITPPPPPPIAPSPARLANHNITGP